MVWFHVVDDQDVERFSRKGFGKFGEPDWKMSDFNGIEEYTLFVANEVTVVGDSIW